MLDGNDLLAWFDPLVDEIDNEQPNIMMTSNVVNAIRELEELTKTI
jgi:hypothetical protein